MSALARAANEQDDAAIKELVCAANWREHYTFESLQATMAEFDPRLAEIRYLVWAGEVRDETGNTATGTLVVEVEGIPEDLSAEAEAALNTNPAPLPIWLIHEDDTIDLIKENGRWVAC